MPEAAEKVLSAVWALERDGGQLSGLWRELEGELPEGDGETLNAISDLFNFFLLTLFFILLPIFFYILSYIIHCNKCNFPSF